MKHMLHEYQFGATYEVRATCAWQKIASHWDPCAVTTSTPKRSPARAPSRSWRLSLSDPRVAGLFWQVLVVAIAVAIVAWLWSNAIHNLSVRRISTGFAFPGPDARLTS